MAKNGNGRYDLWNEFTNKLRTMKQGIFTRYNHRLISMNNRRYLLKIPVVDRPRHSQRCYHMVSETEYLIPIPISSSPGL